MTVARASQVVVESLSTVTAKSRVSQAVVEVLSSSALSGISLRGAATSATGGNPSTTISLPTGTTVGDVTLVAATWTSSTTGAALPAGWTTLFADSFSICGYRVFQSGDPSSISINSGGTSSYMTAAAISYSGCDAAAPVDVCDWHAFSRPDTNIGLNTKYRVPSLSPNFNAEQLVCFIMDRQNSSGLGTPTWAGGLTQRLAQGFGPGIAIGDKSLTDGTPTGYIDITWDQRLYHLGVAIALKPSGATAATPALPRPNLAGSLAASANTSSLTLPLNTLGIKDGDTLVVCIGHGATTITPPAGYSAVEPAVSGVGGTYSHVWHTGDTLAPVFTFSSVAYCAYTVAVVRAHGAGAGGVVLDTSGTNSGTGTASTPSKAVATANDLLLAFYYESNSSGGTWTTTPALTNDNVNQYGPTQLFGWQQSPSNPTGQFTATNSSGSKNYRASVLLYKDANGSGGGGGGGGGSGGKRRPRPWQIGSRLGNSFKKP